MSQLSPREGHGARATRAGARFPCSAAAAPPGKGAAGREGLRDTSTLFPIQVCSCAGQVSLAGSRCAPAGTRVVGQGLFFGKSREACGQKNRLRERAPEQSLGHNFAVVQGKERGKSPRLVDTDTPAGTCVGAAASQAVVGPGWRGPCQNSSSSAVEGEEK